MRALPAGDVVRSPMRGVTADAALPGATPRRAGQRRGGATGRRARRWAAGWIAFGALGLAAPFVAADEEAPADFSKALTGDWGGLRSRLGERGVALSLGYVSEAATNPRGGTGRKTRYSDQYSFGTKLDLGRLVDWRDATFELVVTDRNGRNLGDDASLQTLQGVQEIHGRGQTWRLTRLSIRQRWFGGAVDLKVGRLPVGDDFASFACNFQNLTFCGSQPGNVRGELWYSYPVSQWGSRLQVAFGGGTSARIGLYQVNPRYADDSFARHQGLYPNSPSGTTGALVPLEFAWKPRLGELAGSYKAGAWYDTSDADDVALDARRRPLVLTGATALRRNSRRGVYLNLQQQVSGREKGRGASVFLNVTQSDTSTAPSLDRQIAIGLTYRGLFPGRPGDTVGLAFGSNHVNDRVADRVRLANRLDGGGRPVPGSESVVELYFAWTPLPSVSLQPNLQYVRHPGGFSGAESVRVVGLRSSVDF